MSTCPSCSEKPNPGELVCGACGTGLVSAPGLEPAEPFVEQTVAGVYLIRQRFGGGGTGDGHPAIRKQLDAPDVADWSVTTGPATVTGPALEPAVLGRIAERVAPLLGPYASHLVRFLSRRAATAEALCLALAAFIPSRAEQDRLLAWSRGGMNASDAPGLAPPDRAAPPSPPPAPTAPWDPEVLERVRRQLAIHVGPVAAVLVRRGSSRARSPRELYALLAEEIPGEDERQAFRRLAPAAPPRTAPG